MPYYHAPAERPRQPKRFLTTREVEEMAAAGQTEIVLADDMVITDAARETAHDLDVRITRASQQAPAQPRAATVNAVSAAAVAAQAPAQPVARSRGNADPLVQALVHAVRASKG